MTVHNVCYKLRGMQVEQAQILGSVRTRAEYELLLSSDQTLAANNNLPDSCYHKKALYKMEHMLAVAVVEVEVEVVVEERVSSMIVGSWVHSVADKLDHNLKKG